jgi:amidase
VAEWVARTPERSLLDARTRDSAFVGRLLSGLPLRFARRLEPLLHRRVGATFKRFDVILTPTSAKPPLKIGAAEGLGGWATDQIIAGACPYAWPWNVLGWPGVNVPAGFNSEGLPIGVQLLGQANTEDLLLSLAAQLERREHWHEQVAPSQANMPVLA